MATQQITQQYEMFFDLDGEELNSGFIFIGMPNLDPVTNPKPVYWDSALTIPAAQPIRTINGFPARQGAPAQLFTDGRYSILVRDRKGRQVLRQDSIYSFAADLGDASNAALGDALIAVKSALTGGIARNQHGKNADTLHAKDFVSDVTGGSDVTAQLQAAITAAAGKRLDLGGADCTYLITSGLTIGADNTEIYGHGAMIKCTTGSLNNGVNLLTATGRKGIHVEGVKFKNSGYGLTIPSHGVYTGMGYGLAFINSELCSCVDCYFETCGGNNGSQGVTALYFSSCIECYAAGNEIYKCLNGINSDNWYWNVNNNAVSRMNRIIGNTMRECEGQPIVCDTCSVPGIPDEGDVIIGNTCYKCKYGISVVTQNCCIIGNRIDPENYSNGGVGFDGIMLTGRNITVKGNVIVNTYSSGIIAYRNNPGGTGIPSVGGAPYHGGYSNLQEITIEGNIIEWRSGTPAGATVSYGINVINGYSTGNMSGVHVKNNIINNARSYGIRVNGILGDSATVQGNRIVNSGADGIFVTNVPDAHIQDNECFACQGVGINAQGADRQIITGNQCISCFSHGIFLYSAPGSRILHNTCRDNGTSSPGNRDGINAELSPNTVIRDNWLGNSAGGGTTRYGIRTNDATSTEYHVSGNSYQFVAALWSCAACVEVFAGFGDAFAGNKNVWGNGIPTGGAWTRGDRVWNNAPSASGRIGWVCVVSGTPGTWKGFGAIDA